MPTAANRNTDSGRFDAACYKLGAAVVAVLISFAPPARAKTAYLALAGAGGGQGLMGHVFLVIAEAPGRLLDATYYQYALRPPADFNFTLPRALELGAFPFVVDAGPAWLFIKQYTREDRVVVLYQLKLDDARVRQLANNVEADRERRARTPHLDYAVTSSNCGTKVFDLINAVAGAELRLPYASARGSRLDFLDAARAALIVPLTAAPRLDRAPIVESRLIFRQYSLAELQVAVVAFERLDPLLRACGTSAGAREVLARLYGNPGVRRSAEYLNAFRGLFAACAAPRADLKTIYNGHLDFLRFQTDDQAFLDLSARFNL